MRGFIRTSWVYLVTDKITYMYDWENYLQKAFISKLPDIG